MEDSTRLTIIQICSQELNLGRTPKTNYKVKNTVFFLNKNNILITRSLDGKILAGITRDSILNCAKNKNIKVKEKKISLDNIKDCKEAFITSASSFVTPVIQVDNIKINYGKVGEFSNLLRKTYLELND